MMRIEGAAQAAGGAAGSQLAVGGTDFMTLLVAQLQAQDPLSPMDSSEFMSQLAQLQSVTELQAIRGLLATRSEGSVADAVALIGRTVQWTDAATGELLQGAVDRVSLAAGGCRLVVGDTELLVNDVRWVSN